MMNQMLMLYSKEGLTILLEIDKIVSCDLPLITYFIDTPIAGSFRSFYSTCLAKNPPYSLYKIECYNVINIINN